MVEQLSAKEFFAKINENKIKTYELTKNLQKYKTVVR